MQVIFNIVIVTALVALVFSLFSRSLPAVLDSRERRNMLWIATLGILFKLGVVAIWYSFAGNACSEQWPDTYWYDSSGLYIAEQFRSGNFDISGINQAIGQPANPGYPLFVGIIYTLFGHHQWMVSIFNSLAAAVLSMMMYHIAFRIFNPKVAKWTLLLTLFLPFFMHTSFYIVRDTIIAFLVVVAAWSLIRFNEKGIKFGGILLPLIFLLCLIPFRPQYAILLGVLMPLQLIFPRSSLGKSRIAFGLIFLVLFLGIVSYIQPQEQPGLSVMQSQTFEPTAPHTEYPDFFKGVSPRNPGDLWGRMVAYPTAFFTYSLENLFSLFWGSSMLYSRTGPTFHPAWWQLDAIFRIILMPMVLYGGYLALRYKPRKTILFYSFTILLAVTLVLFTNGDLRLGLPMMPFVMMFGAVGCSQFGRIRPFYPLYIVLFAIFAACNVSLYSGALGIVALCVIVLGFLLFVAFFLPRYRLRISLRRGRVV